MPDARRPARWRRPPTERGLREVSRFDIRGRPPYHPPGGRAAIGVATLNVGGVHRDLAPLAVRAPAFGGWFAEHDVDVINFQEVWTPRRLGVLRAALPTYPFPAWRRGVAGQPAGGLVTFSRWPVTGV